MTYPKHFPATITVSLALAVSLTYASESEYNNIGPNVFDIINAQAAYALGYSGAGVSVGVSDDPINFAHPELKGEVIGNVNTGEHGWDFLNHGTHVGGIVAANKDGVGMHGVAYDAYVISDSPMAILLPDGSFEVKENVFGNAVSDTKCNFSEL